jgi:hypothetical protein
VVQVVEHLPNKCEALSSNPSTKTTTKKKLNSQTINDPMKKWTNELDRAFPKEEVQMAKNA